jgi:hypothetical protein
MNQIENINTSPLSNKPTEPICENTENKLLQEALNKINQLEDEIECLTGVMSVMKEDLQVDSSSYC